MPIRGVRMMCGSAIGRHEREAWRLDACAVVRSREPERLREPARPGAEQPVRHGTAPCPHLVEAVRRLERAEQDRRSVSRCAADDVRAPVDPVRAVDVEVTGGAEHHDVPSSRAAERVAGGIGLLVGLHLDDPPADPVDEERPADQPGRGVVDAARHELVERHSPASKSCGWRLSVVRRLRRGDRRSARRAARSPRGSSPACATRRRGRECPPPRRASGGRSRARRRRSARARRCDRRERTSRIPRNTIPWPDMRRSIARRGDSTGSAARLERDGARLPLPSAHRRARGGARGRGDRVELDRAARAARRRVRGRGGRGRGGRERGGAVERHRRAPPRAGRARDRRGRRGRVLGLHVRREREPDRVRRRDTLLRGRGRGDMDDRSRAARPGDRRAARRGRAGPSRDRGRPLRPVLRLRRAAGGLRAPRRRPDPGRDRVARGDVPRTSRRAGRARSRPFPSTATRSSRRAAAGCSSPGTATGSSMRASSPRRRASRSCTTSTRRSGSTTG